LKNNHKTKQKIAKKRMQEKSTKNAQKKTAKKTLKLLKPKAAYKKH